MVCLACRRGASARLCGDCRNGLRPAPDQLLEGGLRITSAYFHRGAARLLVHNLKYRGIEGAGRLLAEAMADLIPRSATLIPIPRVVWRELRHGIDPAAVLASQLAHLTGGARRDLLVPPLFGASQAKAPRDHRRPPMFRAVAVPQGPVVLVDDVVTTGGTVLNAWRALGFGPAMVVSATSASGRLGDIGRSASAHRRQPPGREIRA
jgi:predicted amidophosphoribosyltransferase